MPTLSIRQLFELYPKGLRVSHYQRHYVWGQWSTGRKDAAALLTECLIDSYRKGSDYFLQGITTRRCHLVDGQQRLTYLILTLKDLGCNSVPSLSFDNRAEAQRWLMSDNYGDITENSDEPSQDIYFYKRTLRTVRQALSQAGIDNKRFAEHILDHVIVLHIELEDKTEETAIYRMMNGTKAPMDAADLIKADIIRMASDPQQPNHQDFELEALRIRYATQWDSWIRWWKRDILRQYYEPMAEDGIDLMLKLCLRDTDADFTQPLTHDEMRRYLALSPYPHYKAAKHLFYRMLNAQRHFEAAYDDATTYNRLRAIMLLHPRKHIYGLLHGIMISNTINADELERYYRMSFLGMTIEEIAAHVPESERLDDLIASLSMADVYHSDAKRDVFNLLLRLNIDEDTKLGRKFDFSIWDNRSLEHIFSKSKVWHTDSSGHALDGNDSPINMPVNRIKQDPTFMARDRIVNRDGTQLSEHCIGNLVLLYGTNNASFGNATFDQKKMMFLSPDVKTVFQSRNLLHTVCVFAANSWDHNSIVENYNQTLKNLKVYYGY